MKAWVIIREKDPVGIVAFWTDRDKAFLHLDEIEEMNPNFIGKVYEQEEGNTNPGSAQYGQYFVVVDDNNTRIRAEYIRNRVMVRKFDHMVDLPRGIFVVQASSKMHAITAVQKTISEGDQCQTKE